MEDPFAMPKIRERPRGVENSGGWKTYRKFGEKPLPKNVFGPPAYDTFWPPPFLARLSVISLKRKGHRPDQSQFQSVLSKTGFGEHTLQYVFPPPKFTRYVLPPPQPLPNKRCPGTRFKMLSFGASPMLWKHGAGGGLHGSQKSIFRCLLGTLPQGK